MTVHHHPHWPQKIHLGVWYCNLDHPNDALFTTVEGFRAHYETNHPAIYADDRRMKSHIRRDRKRGQRDEHFCPLCENRYDYRSASLSHSGLLEHIREHLRCLAMFSLPFVDLNAVPESPDVIPDDYPTLSSISNNRCAPFRENNSVGSFVWGEQTYNIPEMPIDPTMSVNTATMGLLREQMEKKIALAMCEEDQVLPRLRHILDTEAFPLEERETLHEGPAGGSRPISIAAPADQAQQTGVRQGRGVQGRYAPQSPPGPGCVKQPGGGRGQLPPTVTSPVQLANAQASGAGRGRGNAAENTLESPASQQQRMTATQEQWETLHQGMQARFV